MFAIAISDKNCQNESITEIQKFYNSVGYLGHMCRKGHKEKKLWCLEKCLKGQKWHR